MAELGESGEAGSEGEPSRDAGLAYERTQLAWNRTGLAVLVVAAILLRRLWPLEGYRSVLALALIGFGCGTWAVGMTLARRPSEDSDAPGLLGIATCRMLSIGTFALAVAGLLAAVFPV